MAGEQAEQPNVHDGRMPRRFRTAVIALIVFTILLTIGIIAVVSTQLASMGRQSQWTPQSRALSQEHAKRIISALYAHHERYQDYPPTLNQLRPDFIDAIPPAVAGNPHWIYRPYADHRGFSIAFAASKDMFPVCVYLAERGEWHIEE